LLPWPLPCCQCPRAHRQIFLINKIKIFYPSYRNLVHPLLISSMPPAPLLWKYSLRLLLGRNHDYDVVIGWQYEAFRESVVQFPQLRPLPSPPVTGEQNGSQYGLSLLNYKILNDSQYQNDPEEVRLKAPLG